MNSKAKALVQSLLGLSVLGWLDSIYTLWHRQSLLVEGLTKPSFCNFGKAFNCDSVALSKYSVWFGVPTSAWALIFYSVAIVLGLLAYIQLSEDKPERASQSASMIFLLALIGIVPTAVLAFISFTLLKSVCLMCLITYFINIALLVVAALFFKNQSGAFAKIGGGVKTLTAPIWISFVVLVAFQLFLPKIFESSISGGGGVTDEMAMLYINRHLQAPIKNFSLEGRPSHGPASAPLTIVVYSDFQCPHCAREALTNPQILSQYEGKVRTVYKSFPLDPACNPTMKGGGHPLACVAAKTGYCVFKTKGDEAFYNYKQTLFAGQESMNVGMIKDTALKNGISDAELEACLADYSTQQAILDDVNEATANGVEGTPAVFVNGKSFEGATVPKIFSKMLENYFSK